MALSKEQIEEVRKEAVKYKEATVEAGHAVVSLWQARIDMAIATGDVDIIEKSLDSEIRWGDTNCSCRARALPEE